MKDKKIARIIAERIFLPITEDDVAVSKFIERVVIPSGVREYSIQQLESYIRDALKRGADHWEICSPADTEVSSFADTEDQ